MERELRESMIKSAETGKKFIPRDKIDNIVTPISVKRELQGRLQQPESNIDRLVEQIFTPPTRRRIFSILLLIEKVEKIEDVIADDLWDRDLPLLLQKHRRGRNDPTHPTGVQHSGRLQSWSTFLLESFETYQYMFTAPFFRYSPEGAQHYALGHDDIILPFIEDGVPAGVAAGGYSDVWRVKIHPAHHNCYRANVSLDPRVHAP